MLDTRTNSGSMSGSTKDAHTARIAATPSLAVELLAGSIAGAAQVIVGQPLDTIKTRAQIAPSEFLHHLRGGMLQGTG